MAKSAPHILNCDEINAKLFLSGPLKKVYWILNCYEDIYFEIQKFYIGFI